jgi:hypothetical protein
MAIPVPDDEGGGFTRHLTPAGRTNAVCADVHYLGLVEQKKFNSEEKELVPMLLLVFATGDTQGNAYHNPEMGWPLTVAHRYRFSLAPQANLRKVIEKWCNGGRALTDEQVATLKRDIEAPLLGRTAELSVTHSDDGKYANIADKGKWIEALPNGYTPMKIPSNYVRIKDRPPREAQQQDAPAAGATPGTPPARQAASDPFGGGDDPFGGPMSPPIGEGPRPNTYDNYQAPPMNDFDPEIPF